MIGLNFLLELHLVFLLPHHFIRRFAQCGPMVVAIQYVADEEHRPSVTTGVD